MVLLAQEGARRLVVHGWESLWHPAAWALLRDVRRLSFAEVVARGDGSATLHWPDEALVRLRKGLRFEVLLSEGGAAAHDLHLGLPGHHEATMRALARLQAAGLPAMVRTVPCCGPASEAAEVGVSSAPGLDREEE
jgi:hypothetical protein